MVKRVVFGEVANERVGKLQDINPREFALLGVLAIAVIALGVWPEPVVAVLNSSVDNLVQHIAVSKL
jgi:NADH-quinone oxidoreductase subunit M